MGEHPIENLMNTAMNSIQNMVDVNTIVGEPIQSMNGITIIPISKFLLDLQQVEVNLQVKL